MDRQETPADSGTSQELTSLPADLADGHYRAVVLDVITAVTHRQTNRTVQVRIDSPESGHTLCTTLLPASAVGSSTTVRPDTVYNLFIEDGTIVETEFALDPTIRRNTTEISSARYAVPLRWTNASAGRVTREPYVLPLHRHHSLLVTGEPGAGKTECLKLLLPQIESDRDEPVVVFNFKDDYTDWARDHATRDIVRLSLRDSTDHWNIFREVTTEAEFEQLGKTLFAERERTAKNPFFPRAARQLFVAVLTYLSREGEKSGLAPDMRELRDFFGRFSSVEVFELLSEHEDLRGAVEAINPEASRQAAGVYATLQSVVRELLVGDFCRPNGTFSIREYIANPAGRVLVLDYPIAEGDRVTPVFRLWIDRAIKHALADRTRNAYFVLDEFARIPHIERLDTLVATGRARNTQAILGLQSLSQLAQTYDDATVDALLSGLTQEVFLRSGDERTVEYVRSRLGTFDDVAVTDRGGGTETSISGSPLSGQLQRFADGEGIVYATRGWVHVRVPMWRELERETQQVLKTRERACDGENQTTGGRGR